MNWSKFSWCAWDREVHNSALNNKLKMDKTCKKRQPFSMLIVKRITNFLKFCWLRGLAGEEKKERSIFKKTTCFAGFLSRNRNLFCWFSTLWFLKRFDSYYGSLVSVDSFVSAGIPASQGCPDGAVSKVFSRNWCNPYWSPRTTSVRRSPCFIRIVICNV